MKYFSPVLQIVKRFHHNFKSYVKLALVLLVILLTSFFKISAQSGTLTFYSASTANLGTMLYDNKTYSTDISSVEIKVFNASSEANAASRTSTGSLVFVGPPDLNSTHPAIFSNNSTSGTLVFDYTDTNRPKYIVLASTSGAEFRFSSVYIVEPDVWIKPPKIKFEGFRNGTSTGSVYLDIDQNSGEYEKTFDASYFPVNIFGNVDEVRISRGYTDEFTGNLDGFNNFVFSAPVTSYVIVSTNTLGIGAAESSTATFNITSNTSWSVSSNQTWLTASPSSGDNNSTVILTAQANPSTTTSRSATVTVTGGNTITVTQAASNASLSVSSNSLNVASAANSTVTFDITSNVSWTVSKDQTWLSVAPVSGSNNATVTLTAQANPNAATRTATVSVSGVGTPKTITVTQAAATPTLSVSSNSLSMAGAVNSTANFQIISNTDWSISSNQSWLSASPSSSNGSAWITLTATSANTNTTKRVATITVSATGVTSQTITVEQDGSATVFSVSPTTINVGSSSGTTSFTVTSNISWTTLIDQSWVTISPTSGTTTSLVNVNYGANTSTTERTSTITINGTNGDKKYVQIVQAGVAKSLSVSKSSLNVTEVANNTATFDITSNTSWNISSSQTWLSVSPSGGVNDASITVKTMENNPFAVTRNAIVTISADGLADKTISVTQAAGTASLSVSDNNLSVAYGNSSTVTFDITSNCDWSVQKDQTWLSVSDVSGFGNKTITLTASENPINSKRFCTVTVKATGVEDKVITVSQLENIATGSENIKPNLHRVWSTKGGIHISDIEPNEVITIYSILGKTIFSSKSKEVDKTIPLQTGIYLLRVGNETQKIFVE